MKLDLSPTRGLLAMIVFLLAINVLVMLARPGAAQSDHFFPQLPAGAIVKLDGAMIATTNQNGDVLYIWQLGRYVNDGYESVNVRNYSAH